MVYQAQQLEERKQAVAPISKRLLPFTTRNLYTTITLDSWTKAELLMDSVKKDPNLGTMITFLDIDIERAEDAQDALAEGDAGADLLAEPSDSTAENGGEQKRDTIVEAGAKDRIKDEDMVTFFASLSKLRRLSINESRITSLFFGKPPAPIPLPTTLRELRVAFGTQAAVTPQALAPLKACDELTHVSILVDSDLLEFHNLLTAQAEVEDLPDSIPFSSVTHLRLAGTLTDPGMGRLASCFPHVNEVQLYPTPWDVHVATTIAHLGADLQTLSITQDAFNLEELGPVPVRAFDDRFSRLAKLEHLSIDSPASLTHLFTTLTPALPLATLSLGRSASISFPQLTTFVNGPTRPEALTTIEVNSHNGMVGKVLTLEDLATFTSHLTAFQVGEIDEMPTVKDWVLPVWSTNLEYRDALTFIKAAASHNVVVDGDLLSAVSTQFVFERQMAVLDGTASSALEEQRRTLASSAMEPLTDEQFYAVLGFEFITKLLGPLGEKMKKQLLESADGAGVTG